MFKNCIDFREHSSLDDLSYSISSANSINSNAEDLCSKRIRDAKSIESDKLIDQLKAQLEMAQLLITEKLPVDTTNGWCLFFLCVIFIYFKFDMFL